MRGRGFPPSKKKQNSEDPSGSIRDITAHLILGAGLRPGAADLGILGKFAFSGFFMVFLFLYRKIDFSIKKPILRSKTNFE